MNNFLKALFVSTTLIFVGCSDKPSDSYIIEVSTRFYIQSASYLQSFPYKVNIIKEWPDTSSADVYWALVELSIEQPESSNKSVQTIWRFVKQNNEWSGSIAGFPPSEEDIIDESRSEIVNNLNQLATSAQLFYVRPSKLGGGGDSFKKLTADSAGILLITPRDHLDNKLGTYSISEAGTNKVVLLGVGKITLSDGSHPKYKCTVTAQSCNVDRLN